MLLALFAIVEALLSQSVEGLIPLRFRFSQLRAASERLGFRFQ